MSKLRPVCRVLLFNDAVTNNIFHFFYQSRGIALFSLGLSLHGDLMKILPLALFHSFSGRMWRQ